MTAPQKKYKPPSSKKMIAAGWVMIFLCLGLYFRDKSTAGSTFFDSWPLPYLVICSTTLLAEIKHWEKNKINGANTKEKNINDWIRESSPFSFEQIQCNNGTWIMVLAMTRREKGWGGAVL